MAMNNKRPKILYITEPMATGILTWLMELTRGLIDQYDITIAYGIRPETPKDLSTCFDARVKLIEVKNFTRSLNPSKDIPAFFELKKICKEEQPDIIHLNSSKAGALGRYAFNDKKVPVFYTPHGYSFLMSDSSSMKRRIYRFVEKICAKRGTTIACSQGEYEEALKLGGKAEHIDNGIDMESIDVILKDRIKEDNKRFTVYTSGRISAQKNPELFNQIALLLPEINFIWIGKGDQEDKLTSKNIKITGWLDRKKALEISDDADLFLLPSRWEGLSISLLEAMYLNKPVIVSDILENKAVIHQEENGLICHKAEEYAASIHRCMQDKELVKRLTANARKDILNHYNDHVMAKQYDQLYQKALKEYSRR